LFRKEAEGHVSIELTADAQPDFSTDERGERVFYVTAGSQGRLWEGADRGEIDNAVGWGRMLPDGSALLYTVGDQLRRTTLPEIVPIPVVTNKFRQLGAFSPDFSHVLYSTTVVYEGGERRDLLLTPTTGFNPTPLKLVATPEARLSRATFTRNSRHTVYLTGAAAEASGTLHVRAVTGAAEITAPGVDTVAAARDALLVFSDARGNPDQYPILADLKLLNAEGAEPPSLLQARIVDGRSFYVTADGQSVVYARPADAQDPSSDVEGLWLHPLP